MAGGSVKIRIDGDSSGFENTLKGVTEKTKAGLADVKAGIDMAAAAISKFAEVAKKGIDYNAQIEQLQTSFEVMTGSAEKAEETVKRLRVMGAETPFETADLASVTQLLMQYGFTADDALEKMSMLGDIAQGNKEAMVSIATGYAQMSSAGKVNLQDIKQMINGGFNPLQEISERTGESMESLYDRISKGTMQISEITDSMKYATSEGGKFFQSMEKQSQTLSGQLSTLTDNVNELLGSITRGMSDDLAGSFLPAVNEMIGQLQNAMETGGTDALINTATDMIPDLLDMLYGKLEAGISALSKWAPKGVEALMKAVPSAIKASTSAIPQITSALFDVSSVVIRDLVGMLPELIPMILEGAGNLLASVAVGLDGIVSSLFDGIEQAFHQGQTKIMGVWRDNDTLSDFNFKVDMSLVADTSEATSAVSTAYGKIRDALMQSPLTPAQREEILGMIGSDYDAIYAKLKSFGLEDGDATALATTITNAGDTISEAYKNLNISVPLSTVMLWFAQAQGSKIALKTALSGAGLDEGDITQITALYDDMVGNVTDKTPNIAESIFNELTDGLADDEKGLQGKIEGYLKTQNTAIENAYKAQIANLDPNDPDYTAKMAKINEEYASAKADLEAIGADLGMLVETLAGAATSTVKSHWEEFAEVERAVANLETRLEKLSQKSEDAGEAAFRVVKSGAQADEATVELAVNYKVAKFALDKQDAQDAYEDAIAELNRQLADNEITVEDYNAGVASAEATRDAAIKAAQEEYQRAFGAILRGLLQSQGIEVDESSPMRAALAERVSALISEISENGLENVDPSKFDGLGEALNEILGDSFGADNIDLALQGGTIGPKLNEALALLVSGLDTDALSSLAGETFEKALKDGILEGTDFDVGDDENAKILAMFSAMFPQASETTVGESGEALGNEAAAGVEKSKDAFEASSKSAADGAITGIDGKQTDAYNAGVRLANSINSGFRNTLEINSPSRVMIQNGEYVGQGLEQGLTASMARAVMVAKRISGQIVTAADLSQTMRVNIPGLAQEIVVANEQSTTPVNLDGKQIATIQGANNRAQLAFERARTARGFGY